MPGSTQKFSKELLGVFIQTATTASKSIEIVKVSWCLNQVDGGSLNSDKLVEHLIDSINKSDQFKIMLLKKLPSNIKIF